MSEFTKLKNQEYFPVKNGKSHYMGNCSNCGNIIRIFAWKGCKKCRCGKIVIPNLH